MCVRRARQWLPCGGLVGGSRIAYRSAAAGCRLAEVVGWLVGGRDWRPTRGRCIDGWCWERSQAGAPRGVCRRLRGKVHFPPSRCGGGVLLPGSWRGAVASCGQWPQSPPHPDPALSQGLAVAMAGPQTLPLSAIRRSTGLPSHPAPLSPISAPALCTPLNQPQTTTLTGTGSFHGSPVILPPCATRRSTGCQSRAAPACRGSASTTGGRSAS